uniref:SFRICE_036453 n=1 Tax=Spodoptera frugiperda TaxID=7108 RepID=A0A2H1VZL8_SPOFR
MLYVQRLQHFIFIQDREHQNRIHLAGTVEELKKFNSRRRLRAATLAAAAADDEEDEEQPARRAVMLEEANAAAVNLIVESLDDVAVLQDGPTLMDVDLFLSVLDDLQLRALLEIYDRIASTVVVTSGRAPAAEGRARCRQALEAASRLRHAGPAPAAATPATAAAIHEIRRLLALPHIKVRYSDIFVFVHVDRTELKYALPYLSSCIKVYRFERIAEYRFSIE